MKRFTVMVMVGMLPTLVHAAQVDFPTTAGQDAIIARRAEALGITVNEFLVRACSTGFHRLNSRYMEEQLREFEQVYKEADETKREDFDEMIEQEKEDRERGDQR